MVEQQLLLPSLVQSGLENLQVFVPWDKKKPSMEDALNDFGKEKNSNYWRERIFFKSNQIELF
jgi:hypothetical protein